MSAETTICNEHFSTFVGFAESRPELHTDATAYLQSFAGTQIALGAVAYIIDFATKANKKIEILEVATQWGKTKKELQKAVESSLS